MLQVLYGKRHLWKAVSVLKMFFQLHVYVCKRMFWWSKPLNKCACQNLCVPTRVCRCACTYAHVCVELAGKDGERSWIPLQLTCTTAQNAVGTMCHIQLSKSPSPPSDINSKNQAPQKCECIQPKQSPIIKQTRWCRSHKCMIISIH